MENLVAIILIVTQHFQLLTLVVARQRRERAMVVAMVWCYPSYPIGDVAMIEIVVSHSSYEMHSCRLYDRRVENEHNPL